MNKTSKLVTTDKKSLRYWTTTFASAFAGNLPSYISWVDGQQDSDWGSKALPL